MIPTITSITMTRELVESILADYLNRAIFRTPVSVTGSEVIDESVILTLTDTELVATPNRITWTYPERSERIYTTTTAPIPGQLNGNSNGHHADADLVGADLGVRPDVLPAPEPTPEVTPAEAPKRRSVTPEQDAEILRLHAEGWSEPQIAAELNIGKSTVYYRIEHVGETDGAG